MSCPPCRNLIPLRHLGTSWLIMTMWSFPQLAWPAWQCFRRGILVTGKPKLLLPSSMGRPLFSKTRGLTALGMGPGGFASPMAPGLGRHSAQALIIFLRLVWVQFCLLLPLLLSPVTDQLLFGFSKIVELNRKIGKGRDTTLRHWLHLARYITIMLYQKQHALLIRNHGLFYPQVQATANFGNLHSDTISNHFGNYLPQCS